MRSTTGDFWAPRGVWSGELDEFEEAGGSGTPPVTSLRMRPTPPAPKPKVVRARILWPALGFPAVIAPRAQPPTSGEEEIGNATRCICVLVASDSPILSKADAARYLRYVPWQQRGRRHLPAGGPGSFAETDLEVRSHERRPMTTAGPRDLHGELISFGGDRGNHNGITASLSDAVKGFYQQSGLKYLYEIRVSERRSGASAGRLLPPVLEQRRHERGRAFRRDGAAAGALRRAAAPAGKRRRVAGQPRTS